MLRLSGCEEYKGAYSKLTRSMPESTISDPTDIHKSQWKVKRCLPFNSLIILLFLWITKILIILSYLEPWDRPCRMYWAMLYFKRTKRKVSVIWILLWAFLMKASSVLFCSQSFSTLVLESKTMKFWSCLSQKYLKQYISK